MTHMLGKRPPKNAKAIPFGRLYAALVPDHPSTYDPIQGKVWEILHNDEWGDCVVVTYYTLRRIASWLVGKDDYPPSDDRILALYRTQNPNFDPTDPQHGGGSQYDGGMDIQTLLEMLHKDGWDGTKVVAFAKVDHTNVEELKAALYAIGALWIGCVVSQDNEQEFGAHRPWTVGGQPLGGHSITGTGYTRDVVSIETWADEGYLSNDYVADGQNGVDEAWLVLFPEHVENLTDEQKTALNTAYKDITGSDIQWPDTPTPQPQPEPTPTPEPTPAPTPAPNNDVYECIQQAKRRVNHVFKDLADQISSLL